ncbi:MAG: hypothetical protein N2Z74_06815 [Syntrophales bacterium]|nr:hypothetical protein [Syntrophales bacterium]
MSYTSVLFDRYQGLAQEAPTESSPFFTDLLIDQIIAAVTKDKEAYRLRPFFSAPLSDPDTILFRQEVMRDLEDRSLRAHIAVFAAAMGEVRRCLASLDRIFSRHHRSGWFLEAVDTYTDALVQLAARLREAHLVSRGLQAFRDYLAGYLSSPNFQTLKAGAAVLKKDLSRVSYCLLIKDNTVKVRKYEGEEDYTTTVEKAFARFKQGTTREHRAKLPPRPALNHVDAKILDLVAYLYPETFALLEEFSNKHVNFVDETIALFDREVQFYIAYLDYIEKFKQRGLPFCYPEMTLVPEGVFCCDGFDLALAERLCTEGKNIVVNDFHLTGQERILVVTGPNQGGKTTFARMFGQLHYLAALGCPVPGRAARLAVFDNIFTHFEKEEDMGDLRGKLKDDLVRIHDILSRATGASIVIMNEIFTSTTLADALFLARKIMERIIRLDLLCVCVTFIDELSILSEKTVSMVSTVDPNEPGVRTYKIVRRPADGLSYAVTLAKRYGLTYDLSLIHI